MKTSPSPFDAWLPAFREIYALPMLLAATEELAAKRADLAAAYLAENLPPLFADAAPTVLEIQEWIASIVHRAYDHAVQQEQRAVTVHTGPSLLILGPTGVGKTFEAYGAMRTISALGLHTQWLVVFAPDLYALLRPRHGIDSQAEFMTFADAPLLVVDDLGASKHTEFVEDVNLRLINHRNLRQLPTIFTSNVPSKELGQALGERVASRLMELTTKVVMKGADRRRAAS